MVCTLCRYTRTDWKLVLLSEDNTMTCAQIYGKVYFQKISFYVGCSFYKSSFEFYSIILFEIRDLIYN